MLMLGRKPPCERPILRRASETSHLVCVSGGLVVTGYDGLGEDHTYVVYARSLVRTEEAMVVIVCGESFRSRIRTETVEF